MDTLTDEKALPVVAVILALKKAKIFVNTSLLWSCQFFTFPMTPYFTSRQKRVTGRSCQSAGSFSHQFPIFLPARNMPEGDNFSHKLPSVKAP